MPDIKVTCLITDLNPADISGSIAERGANAGPETWANAVEATADEPLLKPSERAPIREFFKGFGAWDAAEIAAWTDNELDALVLQYAAGDLRELQDLAPGDGLGDIDWDEAERLQEEGSCGGTLYVSGTDLYVMLSN